MSIIQTFSDNVKKAIRSWLQIVPAQDFSFAITEPLNFTQTVARNRILYRGDPSEIDQYFKHTSADAVSKARFWASSPSKGQRIRKIHSGLPAMITNVLAKIAVNDMLDVSFSVGDHFETVWEQIADENDLRELLKGAIQEVLTVGDGAFKLAYDPEISDFPLIEFMSGEHVQYVFRRGRVIETQFISKYTDEKKRTYILLERYGQGFIKHELYNKQGEQVDLSLLEETRGLQDVTYEGKRMLAVPLLIYKSPKWEGRGRSIYDLKIDNFDALDETISQWQDALRAGRIKRYIPDSMLPRDKNTGEVMTPNPFDNQFTALKDSKAENGNSQIHTDQPMLDYNGFIGTYINNLDLCLQGLVSPSTLGIDTKKLDNAEAQREKEKTTLYTRDEILDVIRKVVPELVQAAIDMHAHLMKQMPEEIECAVEFGEYANPSFEAQVETVGKASSSQIMSIEAQVDTLWGDTKDEAWKEEEVTRIKQEKGVAIVDDPSMLPNGFVGDELRGVDRLDNSDADGNGDASIQQPEAESEPSQSGGDGQGLPMDSMAGAADKKPESGEEPVPKRNKQDIRKT